MKIKLISDFIDYYDHWFDNEGIYLERMSRNNLSRSEMFKLFNEQRIECPKHGQIKDLINVMSLQKKVVIYLDDYEHRGNGKKLMFLRDARHLYPNFYASEFIESNVTSYRELWLGNLHFVLKYSSDDIWRSNVGNVKIDIEVEHIIYSYKRKFKFPIYAIDYVINPFTDNKSYKYLAIDLNTSPMIKGTGLENIIMAKEMADSIKDYVNKT
jgi:hypothetical protein